MLTVAQDSSRTRQSVIANVVLCMHIYDIHIYTSCPYVGHNLASVTVHVAFVVREEMGSDSALADNTKLAS